MMNTLDSLEQGAPIIFVFSHPNHEVAALGTINRLQPHKIIYITDGGGRNRLAETKLVLSELGLLERAVFFNFTEQSVYDALLNLDAKYFESLIALLDNELSGASRYTFFCDAVEFYNPVHDITYPVVTSVRSRSFVYEVPLAYQNRKGEILLQKPLNISSPQALSVLLTAEEQDLKERLLRNVYRSLGSDLELLISADPSLTKMEWFVKDRQWPILPSEDQLVRYDSRGAQLLSEKSVSRAITFRQHYAPTVASFLR